MSSHDLKTLGRVVACVTNDREKIYGRSKSIFQTISMYQDVNIYPSLKFILPDT